MVFVKIVILDLEIWRFGDLKFGDLEIWPRANLQITRSTNLQIYMPGGVNRPSAASQPPSATSIVPVT